MRRASPLAPGCQRSRRSRRSPWQLTTPRFSRRAMRPSAWPLSGPVGRDFRSAPLPPAGLAAAAAGEEGIERIQRQALQRHIRLPLAPLSTAPIRLPPPRPSWPGTRSRVRRSSCCRWRLNPTRPTADTSRGLEEGAKFQSRARAGWGSRKVRSSRGGGWSPLAGPNTQICPLAVAAQISPGADEAEVEHQGAASPAGQRVDAHQHLLRRGGGVVLDPLEECRWGPASGHRTPDPGRDPAAGDGPSPGRSAAPAAAGTGQGPPDQPVGEDPGRTHHQPPVATTTRPFFTPCRTWAGHCSGNRDIERERPGGIAGRNIRSLSTVHPPPMACRSDPADRR